MTVVIIWTERWDENDLGGGGNDDKEDGDREEIACAILDFLGRKEMNRMWRRRKGTGRRRRGVFGFFIFTFMVTGKKIKGMDMKRRKCGGLVFLGGGRG